MADAPKTLEALMTSLNVGDEESINNATKDLDPRIARQLLDVLMKASGGESKNLPEGQGGFLTGLKKVVESRKRDANPDLPKNPRELNPADKLSSIEAHSNDLEKSNDELAEGIKLILSSKTSERLDSLREWPGELSDEDFARKVNVLKDDFDLKNDDLISKLKNVLDEQKIDFEALLKKHRIED